MNDIQIFELYDFVYTPFWHTRFFHIFIALVLLSGVLALCFLALVWYRKRMRNKALDAVAHIKQLKLRHVEPSVFYAELAHLIKWYFSAPGSFIFMATTEREFLTVFSHACLSSNDEQFLNTLLLDAELAKFAQKNLSIEHMSKSADYAIDLIMRHDNYEKNKGHGRMAL